MRLMRIKHYLPALIRLIPIETSLYRPSSVGARDLLNGFNPGDSRIDIGIARDSDGQAAAYDVELSCRRLQDQHRAIVGDDRSCRP